VQEYFSGNATFTSQYYFYTDGLGSVMYLANQNGNTTASCLYSVRLPKFFN
jgi:hypothetical protein